MKSATFTCEICGEGIYEGEEYYDLCHFGKICTQCIEEAHCWEAPGITPDDLRAEELHL